MAKKVTKASILSRIRPVSEVPQHTTMLIYGNSGTGKTAFAATSPKPLLFLDLRERGTETIREYKDTDVLEINTWEEFQEAYWGLENDRKYETIVLDQVSALQGIAIAKHREDNDFEPQDFFSKRDWGHVSGMMTTWLSNYRNLGVEKGKNILFLAHQRTFGGEGEDSGEDQIEPSIGARLGPSVESFLCGAVSVIGNTFIREHFDKEKNRTVEYRMRVGPHAYYRAKIRTPPGSVEIPDSIKDPTFEKIMRLSRGESAVKKVKRK
jgi:hypothetical protein